MVLTQNNYASPYDYLHVISSKQCLLSSHWSTFFLINAPISKQAIFTCKQLDQKRNICIVQAAVCRKFAFFK